MSLNIYGWKTMPHHAADYARLVNAHNIDILLLQEGVEDWQLTTPMPTDYSRADALQKALGNCWQRRWQILVNQCRAISFNHSERFDLADGPMATRTGEMAELYVSDDKSTAKSNAKSNAKIVVINVHWDHESETARTLSAEQTAAVANRYQSTAVVVAGDFNSQCNLAEKQLAVYTYFQLIVDGGIDCIFAKNIRATGQTLSAMPSDHPAVIASLNF
jgi:hypothetical protein